MYGDERDQNFIAWFIRSIKYALEKPLLLGSISPGTGFAITSPR